VGISGPVRVLHVVATSQRRGAEIFARDLIGELKSLGLVEQTVIVLREGPAPRLEFPVKTRSLTDTGESISLSRTVLRLRRVLREERPDVVQAHGGEPQKYAALATVGSSNPRILYRRIAAAHPSIRSGWRRWVYSRLMNRASAVVLVAESLRPETVSTFGVPDDRIVAIPRGVDPARLATTRTRSEIRRELELAEGDRVLLSLGALTVEKDPLAHVSVAARVGPRVKNFKHLIVGDGPMAAEVRTAIQSAGLGKDVRLLGARADVADLLAACDVMLLASTTEGMPGAVIEAGLSGLPVAAYAVGGVPEVVIDGSTGMLAVPGDIGALSDAVHDLLTDQKRANGMGEAARERCLERFAIKRIAPPYLELLMVLGEQRAD